MLSEIELPTRDRSELFFMHRENARERRGVLPVFEESPPPLGWVQAVAKVEHAEGTITKLLQQLQELQAVHIVEDATLDGKQEGLEQQIVDLSRQIMSLFKTLDTAIKRVVQDADDQEMLLNVHRGLVTRVAALHEQYRVCQQKYSDDLKQKQEMKNRLNTMLSSSETQKWEEDEAKECRIDDLKLQGYAPEHIESILLDEEVAKEKAEALTDISSALKELHSMFSDLHALIIEQGTMIDRVDQNISQARSNMQYGAEQIRDARKV